MQPSDDDLSVQIWKNRDILRHYRLVKDQQIKTINSESKNIFLKRCLRLQIVPNTLQVTNAAPANNKHAGPLLPEEELRWTEAQRTGGLALVREALVQEQRICSDLRGKLRRMVTELEDNVEDGSWSEVEARLASDKRRAAKTAQNRHRQKLRQLLGDRAPAWLNRSAPSVLEQTEPDIVGPATRSQPFTSTPSRPVRPHNTRPPITPVPPAEPAPVLPPAAPPAVPVIPAVPVPLPPGVIGNIDQLLREERERAERRMGRREINVPYRLDSFPRVEDVQDREDANNNVISEDETNEETTPRRRRQKNKNMWRNKRRRLRQKDIRNNLPDLFTNLSKHNLTPGQRNLLNRGPNFVPINLNVNTTGVEVASW